MRLRCAWLAAIAMLSCGCTTVPTVMGISGRDSILLNTRDDVRDALGTPVASGAGSDTTYEDFQVKNGCDQIVWGFRVPAFQPLEEFHIWGQGEVQLLKVKDYSCIPAKGRNAIVVCLIENRLYFRLFDEYGNMVVDTDETKLRAKASQIAELRKHLDTMLPPHKLTEEEKDWMTSSVASIVGKIPLGSFEIGVASVCYCGPIFKVMNLPTEDNPSRQRIFRGQVLRFEYDKLGNVANVYLDGEFLLSPRKNPTPDAGK